MSHRTSFYIHTGPRLLFFHSTTTTITASCTVVPKLPYSIVLQEAKMTNHFVSIPAPHHTGPPVLNEDALRCWDMQQSQRQDATGTSNTSRSRDPPGTLMTTSIMRNDLFDDANCWSDAEVNRQEVTSTDDENGVDDSSEFLGEGDEEDDGMFVGCDEDDDDDDGDEDDSSIAFSDIMLHTEEDDPFLLALKRRDHPTDAPTAAYYQARAVPRKPVFSAHKLVAYNMATNVPSITNMTPKELMECLEKRLRPYMKLPLTLPPLRTRKRPNCLFLNHLGTRRPTPPRPVKKRKVEEPVVKTTTQEVKPQTKVIEPTLLPQDKAVHKLVLHTPPQEERKNAYPMIVPESPPQLLPKLLTDGLWNDDLKLPNATNSSPIAVPPRQSSKAGAPTSQAEPGLSLKKALSTVTENAIETRPEDNESQTKTAPTCNSKKAEITKWAKHARKSTAGKEAALRDMEAMKKPVDLKDNESQITSGSKASGSKVTSKKLKKSKRKMSNKGKTAVAATTNISEARTLFPAKVAREGDFILSKLATAKKAVVTTSTDSKSKVSSNDDEFSISSKSCTLETENLEAIHEPLPAHMDNSFHYFSSNPDALSLLAGHDMDLQPPMIPSGPANKRKPRIAPMLMMPTEGSFSPVTSPGRRPPSFISFDLQATPDRRPSMPKHMLLNPEMDIISTPIRYPCSDYEIGNIDLAPTPPEMPNRSRRSVSVNLAPPKMPQLLDSTDEDLQSTDSPTGDRDDTSSPKHDSAFRRFSTPSAPFRLDWAPSSPDAGAFVTPDGFNGSPRGKTKVLLFEPEHDDLFL